MGVGGHATIADNDRSAVPYRVGARCWFLPHQVRLASRSACESTTRCSDYAGYETCCRKAVTGGTCRAISESQCARECNRDARCIGFDHTDGRTCCTFTHGLPSTCNGMTTGRGDHGTWLKTTACPAHRNRNLLCLNGREVSLDAGCRSINSRRAKCPSDFPVMCVSKKCEGARDHCCAVDLAGCGVVRGVHYGGVLQSCPRRGGGGRPAPRMIPFGGGEPLDEVVYQMDEVVDQEQQGEQHDTKQEPKEEEPIENKLW